MKALILKDFYTLKESGLLMLIMLFVVGFIAFFGGEQNAVFIICYITVFTSVLVLNTLTYDEAENAHAFLMTMPFSRKQYIRAKYAFGLITGFTGCFLTLILVVAVGMLSSGNMGAEMWWSLCCGVLAGVLLMQAVAIPLQLKFGGQKGRLVIIVLIAVCVGFGVSIVKTGGLTKLISYFVDLELNQVELALGIAAGVLILLTVSYQCSVRIMEKKDL